MLLFDYRCDVCNLVFEEFVESSNDVVRCPSCNNVSYRLFTCNTASIVGPEKIEDYVSRHRGHLGFKIKKAQQRCDLMNKKTEYERRRTEKLVKRINKAKQILK